jgi:hypothetical protein
MESFNPHILLIQGCPRSGTSLLYQIINGHPNIVLSHEMNLMKINDSEKIIDFFYKTLTKYKISFLHRLK